LAAQQEIDMAKKPAPAPAPKPAPAPVGKGKPGAKGK